MIENVDYHITDKCNLKCVSCNHFCPLVPDSVSHKSIEQIEKDLTALSKFRNYIRMITLLGGEPTLHPQLEEIIILTRKLFPSNQIYITTNGTRIDILEKCKDTIINNNIYICLSKYPYCDNYEEKALKIINMFKDRCTVLNTVKMQKGPLVLRRSNTDDEILHCRMRGWCCQLKDCRLYVCNFAAQINYLYDAFPFLKNYIYSGGYESIDLLDEEIDITDIEQIMYSSIPGFCWACNECQRWERSENMEYVDWKRSEKRIDEWVS